jgi:methyl-accepting chemotaxis protein
LPYKKYKEILNLHQKTAQSLDLYQDFNQILANYLDFYSCQLSSIALEKELQVDLSKEKIKFQTSQEKKQAPIILINIAEKNKKLANFLPNYKNCFTAQEALEKQMVKLEKDEFYKNLGSIQARYQNLSEYFQKLAKSMEENNLEESQNLATEISKSEQELEKHKEDFRQKLREILDQFDRKVKKIDEGLESLTKEIKNISSEITANKKF